MLIEGNDIFTMKDDARTIFRRRKIGFVFQSYNLVPVLSVYENIVFPIQLDGGKIDKNYIGSIIETLGLKEKIHAMPNQLSGGQKQRVAIARALAMNPRVLAYDEPTSALDPELRQQVERLILSLKEDGVTQIIVTHDLVFAENVGDQLLKVSPIR